MASFESLSDVELRKKLLDFGYDLPVSINRDFLIKKLQKVTTERSAEKDTVRRKSTPANSRPHNPPPANSNASHGVKNNRLSLNETGLRQRQASHEPEVNIVKGRKSLGSALANSSPAKPAASRSSLSSSTTTTTRSTQRQSIVINQVQGIQSSKLNRVVENRDHEEEDEDDGEEDEEEEEMDIDEGIEEMPSTRVPRVASKSLGYLSSPSSSSYLTRRPREETAASTGAGDGSSNIRFQSYLNYFKGDTRSDPLAQRGSDEPPRSAYYTPPSSPYSPVGGSPSYRKYEESGDEEEEEEGEIRESKMRKLFNKVNPVNWIRDNVKFNWFSSRASQVGGPSQTESYSYNRGYSATAAPGSSLNFSGRYSTSAATINGHWSGGSATTGLGNRIYSPATPPPVVVPPQVAAGRQAGFKAFFSRGERNGYGYSSAGGTTDWASSSHLISKIIVAMFMVAFAIIGGIYYYKSVLSMESGKGLTASGLVIPGSKKSGLPPSKKVISTSMVYPICGLEGVDPDACVPKVQIKNSRTLLTALKEELIQRSKMKGCGGEVEDSISLLSAKKLLYGLTDLKKSEVDGAFNGMLLLVTENVQTGLQIESKEFSPEEEISSRAISTLDNSIATITAVGVSPNILCTIWAGFYALLAYCAFFSILAGAGYLAWLAIKYHRGRKIREEQEMFNMIEKILEMVYQHYENTKNSGGDSYLAVNHIRDELLSPRDRKKKEALWNQVVDHISTNESRVRMEVQHISGEEFRVWRWLPSASPLLSSKYSTPPSSPVMGRHSLPLQHSPPSPLNSGLYPNLGGMGMDLDNSGGSTLLNLSNKWQGQAFEMCDGSPNALPIIPTTCVKIRQMFDTEKDAPESRQSRIERAIMEKCPNSKILHVGIETGSLEGCVYVRCQSKDDARAAYMDLHGWWFDGHLLSVKFLREQRYFSRFPEAKYRTVPLTMSTLSSSIVQPLAGQQTFANSMNIRSGNNNAGSSGPGTSARVRYTMGY